MGYYTDFKITVARKPSKIFYPNQEDLDLHHIAKDLIEVAKYTFYVSTKNDYIYLSDAKWYDHDEEMKTFSLLPKYRDVIFTVDGEGEESGDIWRAIYMNGETKRQQLQVVFPNLSF